MNELLQKHGCANVFTVPDGLKELMSDITREVLREQPTRIFDFIANYLSVLLITREHGIMAVKILEDLCDCKPSVSEHLMQLGMDRELAEAMAQVIKEEIESVEPVEGKEKVRETQILKKILIRRSLDEDMTAKVCQITRNAYRDYWYRKQLLKQNLKMQPEEPWEIAAQHTLELYKRTKPSYSELNRATEKIQAAYRGYYVRRNLLRHLKPKPKKHGPKVELPGPPLDIASSREIDLGPVINLKVREDNVTVMFDEEESNQLGLRYDPKKTLTHVKEQRFIVQQVSVDARRSRTTKQFDYPTPRPRHSSQSPIPKMVVSISDTESLQSSRKQSPRKQDTESRSPSLYSEYREMMTSGLVQNVHKISFAAVPPEVIPMAIGDDSLESPGEVAHEIPEDIADGRSDGDGASIPTASAVSSAADSAASTDIEDYDNTDMQE